MLVTGLLAVVALVGVHLGLGSAAAGWLGWTAVGGLSLAVLALVGVHVAVPVAAIRLRRHLFRRGDKRRPRLDGPQHAGDDAGLSTPGDPSALPDATCRVAAGVRGGPAGHPA